MNLLTWLSSACYRGDDQLLSGSPLEASKDSQAGTHNTGVKGGKQEVVVGCSGQFCWRLRGSGQTRNDTEGVASLFGSRRLC